MANKRYVIVDTENSRAMEEFHGFGLIGKELIAPAFFREAVNGYVEVEVAHPLWVARRNITLAPEDVIVVAPRPLKEVLAEAVERSLL